MGRMYTYRGLDELIGVGGGADDHGDGGRPGRCGGLPGGAPFGLLGKEGGLEQASSDHLLLLSLLTCEEDYWYGGILAA
jgi:hypothetical protein